MPGYFDLPGGKVDFGKHPDDSISRECFEETGSLVRPIRPYKVFTYTSGDRHTVEIIYLVQLKDELTDIVLSKAHDRFRWIAQDEVEQTELSSEMRENILEGFEHIKETTCPKN